MFRQSWPSLQRTDICRDNHGRNNCLLILFISAAAILLGFSICRAKDTVYWLKIDWPPFQILKGEDAGKGRFDRLNKLLQEHLDQYEHENIEMNWARYWQEVKEGNHILNSMAIKTEERLHYTIYSDPVSFSLPHRIIMAKSKIDKMGNPESVSLTEFLTDSQYSGILEQGRSYAATLDSELEKREIEGNYLRKPLDVEQILNMIISGRVDYTIEYPLIVDYMLNKYDLPKEAAIGSIAIKELPPYVVAFVAAPKNSWGKEVIGDLNRVLGKLKQEKSYRDMHLMYFRDEQEKKQLLKIYDKIFQQ